MSIGGKGKAAKFKTLFPSLFFICSFTPFIRIILSLTFSRRAFLFADSVNKIFLQQFERKHKFAETSPTCKAATISKKLH